MVKFWNHLKYHSCKSWKSWLKTICQNLCNNIRGVMVTYWGLCNDFISANSFWWYVRLNIIIFSPSLVSCVTCCSKFKLFSISIYRWRVLLFSLTFMFVTPIKMVVLSKSVAIIATTISPLNEIHVVVMRGIIH